MQATTRSAVVLTVALGLASQAEAQHSFTGTSTKVAVVTSTTSAGETVSNAGIKAQHSVGRGYVADFGKGAMQVDHGLVHIRPQLGATPPIVFAVEPRHGHADGGDTVGVVGFALASGMQVPQVAFGGQAGSFLGQTGPGEVRVATPMGRSVLASLVDGSSIQGNPLGAVDLTVANSNGVGLLPEGFRYTPSLEGVGADVLGASATVLAHGAPGELSIVSYGLPTPGLGLPIAGVSGALELLPFVNLETQPVAPGEPAVATHVFPLPADPNLAGVLIPLQTALVGPSGAAFSDLHLLELVLP